MSSLIFGGISLIRNLLTISHIWDRLMGAFDKLKSRLPSCPLASFGRVGKTA